MISTGRVVVSIKVEDIKNSSQFYQNLGFGIISDDNNILKYDNFLLSLSLDQTEKFELHFGKDVLNRSEEYLKSIGKSIQTQGTKIGIQDPDGNTIHFIDLQDEIQITNSANNSVFFHIYTNNPEKISKFYKNLGFKIMTKEEESIRLQYNDFILYLDSGERNEFFIEITNPNSQIPSIEVLYDPEKNMVIIED